MLLGLTGLDRVRSEDGAWRYIPIAPREIPPPVSQVKSGIIDSGLLSEHPQLKAAIVASRGFTDDGVEDESGHGTLVALQLIATVYRPELQQFGAGGDGAVPQLFSAKVTRKVGNAHVPDIGAVIAAVDWMAAESVDIVNMSLGFTEATPLDKREALCAAMARHPTMLFFVADTNDIEMPVWPASCKDVQNKMVVGELRPATGEITATEATDIVAKSGFQTLMEHEHRVAAAQEHLVAGRMVEARNELAKAMAMEESAMAWGLEAELQGHAGDWDASLKAALKAEELAPEDWRPPILAATALMELGQYPELLDALERAEQNGGGSIAALHYLRFRAHYATDDVAGAEAALLETRRVDPTFPLLEEAVNAFSVWQGRALGQ